MSKTRDCITKSFKAVFSLRALVFACLWWGMGSVHAASTTISFTLDQPSKTSAGVFATDGTLIRTLWSKVYYQAGANVAVWDGLDDNGNAVSAGTYQVKMLQHNTEYVWDGVMGNTSAEMSGPTVYTGFLPLRDMTISGINGFCCSGYNEGKFDFCNFLTTDPQHVRQKWGPDGQPSNIYDRNWSWAASDGSRVYFACSAATTPNNTALNNYPGFVVVANVGDNSPATFTSGVPIINGENTNTVYPNGVYVGTQPGLSGLAVQQNGNLMAVSVSTDNRVYLLNKLSGAAVRNFSVTSPGRLSFSPDGSLWVISANNVICYTNIGVAPVSAVVIPNFSKPLAVAVNPSNANLILVADGGTSQQLKAYNSTGTSLWTYGQAGGYQSNGPAVRTNKFWFYDGEEDGTFLCFAPDGSFWVGDGGNHRTLHFSAALNYLEQIMSQPHSYMTCVDQNNSSRVFNQFLEFSVDYTKPLAQSWTLVNNWKATLDACHVSWNEGLREVTTFPNGRTYALIDNNCASGQTVQELCELTTNGLRLTGIFPFENGGWISLGADGSVRVTSIGVATWYQATLAGFDTTGNPIWNAPALLASASSGATDPVARCCSFGNVRATISTNNVLISFDQSMNNGWHLGGIKLGSNKWLWKASPTSSYLNGLGNYEIGNGVTYAGNTIQAVGRQVIFGYHGEFFRTTGEAAQHMHFYDDGLFIGQFGEALNGHPAFEGSLPGFAGNGHCPNLVMTTNGDYYLWVNDESDHGPQRWHLVNARNIREQSGTGTLGGTITLTAPAVDFPARVTGKSGNQSAELSWLPVAGATAYNIRYSQINGGPYNLIVGTTTSTNFVAGGLTNGTTCYFAVTAITAGHEGPPSEQVKLNPFDTTQAVLLAGSMSEGGQYTPVIDVSSTAANSGQPSYTGAEHLTGVLSLRDLNNYGYGNLQRTAIGTKGYVLYEYQGAATSLLNYSAPFNYAYGYGWKDLAYLGRQYRLDNASSVTSPNGMVASPVAALLFGNSDTNYHYLTIVCPAQFDNPRHFTLSLTSAGGASVQYVISEGHGLAHTFQFLFKGQVTLLADGTAGGGAIVQSVFFDDAAVTYATPSVSSTNASPVTSVPSASTTTISTSQNAASLGVTIALTASVTGGGGVPTGTVTFYDGSTSLGSGTLNSSGVTIFSTAALLAGSLAHSITAVYNGDGTFAGSTSAVLSQMITNPPAASTTTISSSQNPALVGASITLTASVTGNGGVPAGTVTFYDGSSSLGSGTLNGSGATFLSTASLSAGSSPHSITAVYSGNGSFTGSTSVVLSELITNSTASTTTTTPTNAVSGDITNGLVVNYPLAVNGSDSLGGNNLTLVGSPTFSAAAVNWNGTTSVGYSAPQQWPQGSLTVSTWINMASPTVNSTVAACYGNYANTMGNAYLQFYTWSGTLNARIIQDRDVNYIGRSTSASLSKGWHFAVATWNGGTDSSSVKVYLDGVEIDNSNNQGGTFTHVYSGADVPLSVGAQLRAGFPMSAQLSGNQKLVRMYNRALSAGEVSALYANQLPLVTNPPSPPPPVTGLRVLH